MRTFSLQLQLLVRSMAAPFVELLAPPRCGICECEGALLCAECRTAWITGRAVALPPGNLSAAAALGPYEGGLGVAIRTMKYGGVQGLARELGEALVPAIKQVSKRAAFQVTLVPIPTDRARARMSAASIMRRCLRPQQEPLRNSPFRCSSNASAAPNPSMAPLAPREQ
ncbi:MAG: ComF family protein [Candidatus Limnocylindrus sp.]